MAHLLCKAAHTAGVAWGAQEYLQHLEAEPDVCPPVQGSSGPHSSGTLPTHHGGPGGLISCSLLNSSKCSNLFFRCLTSPAGEMSQRKVRAGWCQGSAVQRKDYTESVARGVASAQFTSAKVAIMQRFNAFTGSGISFICPDMNTGEYQTLHALG